MIVVVMLSIFLAFMILMFYHHERKSSEFRKFVFEIESMISKKEKFELLDKIEKKIPDCRNYSELNTLKDLSWRVFNT